MTWEEIKRHLPQYLSSAATKELFESLEDFPKSLDSRFYTGNLKNELVIFQGDGIQEIPVVDIISMQKKNARVIVLSNTCDINPDNKRNFESQIIYAPIIELSKYKFKLSSLSGKTDDQIQNHLEQIKEQRITQILYLPAIGDSFNESIVFLDRIFNIPNKFIRRDGLLKSRLFTLSDFGAYLLSFKLSVHFCRFQDKVERRSIGFNS